MQQHASMVGLPYVHRRHRLLAGSTRLTQRWKASRSGFDYLYWTLFVATHILAQATCVAAHVQNSRNAKPTGGVVRCACGHELADAQDMVKVSAPDALHVMRDAPLSAVGGKNATVSRLRNPAGVVFDLVTTGSAPGGQMYHMPPTAEHTWFPGFQWQILHCAACGRHIGWQFTQQEGTLAAVARAAYAYSGLEVFVGLVLENMRFTRGNLRFRWSPDDEAFLAESTSQDHLDL